jgi:uncharacterized cupin superfamily protein
VPNPTNVWDAELELLDESESGVRGARMLERPRGTRLVSAVWELDPGSSSGPYHLHHGAEELLLVLEGEATLRTPEGERTVRRGDVVHFPVGADGAHQVTNRSGAPVRYLMAAAHQTLDLIEYVDERRVVAYSRRPSLLAEETLFFAHDVDGAAES